MILRFRCFVVHWIRIFPYTFPDIFTKFLCFNTYPATHWFDAIIILCLQLFIMRTSSRQESRSHGEWLILVFRRFPFHIKIRLYSFELLNHSCHRRVCWLVYRAMHNYRKNRHMSTARPLCALFFQNEIKNQDNMWSFLYLVVLSLLLFHCVTL